MAAINLTSVQNPQIQALRKLKDKQERLAAGCYLVEGGKMVQEALACATVRCILAEDDQAARYASLLAAAEAAGAQIILCPRHVLESVCDTKTPQGIAATVALPESGEVRGDWLVALDGVQDPGNVGTILRTADAAGFQGVLASGACADAYGGKVLRATMGAIFRVPVWQPMDFPGALTDLRDQGYAIVSTQLDGEEMFVHAPWPQRLVLVIGSEAEGVSSPVRALATHRLRLPMRGGAESLNAAVAAGILMYDVLRGAHHNEGGSLT